MTFTRRVFLRWSAITSAALGAIPMFRRRAHGQGRTGTAARESVGLEVAKLLPMAYAVLPAELGAARLERATTAFARWVAGYREGEETVHPYGSERLGATGASPAKKWADQLAALNTRARSEKQRPFAELPVEERQALVGAALNELQVTARIPSAIAAPHVALALLAHFLDSPEARNLAYERTIDPRTCRPLANSPKEPVAIRRAGRSS
jgi:hypothetical protein